MVASAIRSIASGHSSSLIAAAFFERTVQIWNLRAADLIVQFETVYLFGGEKGRLALAPNGTQVVTAAWSAGRLGGVASYAAHTGSLLWHRTDLKQTQSVSFAPDGLSVWCSPQSGPTKRLSAKTGETLEEFRGSPRIFKSNFSDKMLLEYRNSERAYILQATNSRQLIQRCSFAILDAAFAPDSVCLACAGGPLRCVELSNSSERWRFSPGEGHHLIEVWYRKVDENFYGIVFGYNRGVRTLMCFNRIDGTPRQVCELTECWAQAFCEETDTLVTSAGDISVSTTARTRVS
jgi:WD40 repeat protein